MDGQVKLMRTQSSLLRSYSTIRLSLHSLNSIAEMNSSSSGAALAVDGDGDEEDQKPHRPRINSAAAANQSPAVVRIPPPVRWFPLLAVVLATLFLSFVYLKSEVDISTSEKLLLVLILFAIALFFAGKNKHLIDRSIFILKQIYDDNSKKLQFSKNRARSSVEWYIGCEKREKLAVSGRRSPSPAMAREGVEFYSNGDLYEGEFHKGKCNGSGVYTYFVNGRYEGDWVDGRYDGYGIESWAKGSRYRGQYRQGLRHGFGLYRFYTGDTYAGEWCNGQYHGVGVQTCSDGSCYIGEFKCGVKHGLGCYHFRNGDRYAGEYFGDKIHGYGVYHFANGHCYEGSWHEGRKQGHGMYTFRNGETKCREWNRGTLQAPSPPLTDSVLQAVQAARKAAENATHLRQVDDQVKKAVRAANRAATAARVAAIKAVQNRMEGKRLIDA